MRHARSIVLSVTTSVEVEVACMNAQEFRLLGSMDRRGRDKDDDDGHCLFDMDTGKRRGGIRRDRWLRSADC